MQHLSISSISEPILTKHFVTNILLDPNLWDTKLLRPKLSWTQSSSWISFLKQKLFLIQNFILTQILFYSKFSLTQNFSGPKLCEHTIFWLLNFFKSKFFWTYQADFSWFNLNITNKPTIFLGFASIEINLVLKYFKS